MDTHIPTRQEAWEILCRYNKSDSLRRHALAVEAVMICPQRRRREMGDRPIHDLDYERRGIVARAFSRGGWPEDYIRAVVSHAGLLDVEP